MTLTDIQTEMKKIDDAINRVYEELSIQIKNMFQNVEVHDNRSPHCKRFHELEDYFQTKQISSSDQLTTFQEN